MNHVSFRPLVVSLGVFAAFAGSVRPVQGDIRRGLLYDLLHPGPVCDPACGSCPSPGCPQGWIEGQLEAEKMRIREHLRVQRMQFYLHNQDHKKLLHPECSPFQDCYWGYYPTCWRQFPGRPHCPPPPGDPLYYESELHGVPDGGFDSGVLNLGPGQPDEMEESLDFAPPQPGGAQPAPVPPSYLE